MAKAKDISGQRFGKLTAIRPTEERRYASVVWECRCDCGNTVFVTGNCLKTGNTKSCGCKGRTFEDLTRQKFGMLSVVAPTEERKYGNVVWECRCDCGNTVFVATNRLRSGAAKSCGCKGKVDESLIDQRFGMLTAIRPTEKRLGGNVVWECRCDCGNTAFVPANNLKSGNTKSCGCASHKVIR